MGILRKFSLANKDNLLHLTTNYLLHCICFYLFTLNGVHKASLLCSLYTTSWRDDIHKITRSTWEAYLYVLPIDPRRHTWENVSPTNKNAASGLALQFNCTALSSAPVRSWLATLRKNELSIWSRSLYLEFQMRNKKGFRVSSYDSNKMRTRKSQYKTEICR